MTRTGIDLFAGIGGFSLAMQRAGIKVTAQVEIDEYCQKVLAKNFPGVKRFRDVRLAAHDLRRYRPWIICGGFPCQDISSAGKGAGIEGDRSNLWWAMWAVINTLRPRWVLVENVPALRTRGSDRVLASLEAIGYTCWPLVVGALHVGAPHQRPRVYTLAHLQGSRLSPGRQSKHAEDISGLTINGIHCFPGRRGAARTVSESGMARTVHGLPGRVDKHRIKALGNAIVPQVAEQILRAIINVEGE